MKKSLVCGALLALSGVAQAGFVPIDSVTPASQLIDPIVASNNFKAKLATPAYNITSYTLGISLGVDTSGTVEFYYYGKEAGYKNDFKVAGLATYTTDFLPNYQDYFSAPKWIGSIDVNAGILDFKFCSYNESNVKVGCVSNAQNDALSFSSFQSIAFNISSNTTWIFWDDSGAGPDDNHDDMLVKAVFRPRANQSVPEPATLGLFGLGLLALGVARRSLRR